MHPQKQQKNLAPRKSQRQIKAPNRYGFNIVSYALQVVEEIDSFEPTTYGEAISCSKFEEQMMVMNEEMESLKKNQTWYLVELFEGKRVVGCKWIFKKKLKSSGIRNIYQRKAIVRKKDYNEIFSLVI